MGARVDRDLEVVRELYSEMELLLHQPVSLLQKRTRAAGWSASEQIHHVLLANKWALSTIIKMLLGHGGFSESGRKNLLGAALLCIGRFPRGRARAPAGVVPDPDMPVTKLLTMLEKQRTHLDRIADQRSQLLTHRRRFRHPLLGYFSAADGIRFVRIHTRHHIKLAGEIMKVFGAP